MRQSDSQFGTGLALVFMTVILWGAQFPIGKAVMVSIDAVHATAIRYGLAAACLAVALAVTEGRAAFDTRGRLGLYTLAGIFGFTLSGLFVYIGLGITRPEHAAVIAALQPSMTALADWWLRGRRPSRFTLACVAVAFVGVVLVITRGDPMGALAGGELTGNLLVLLGASLWVTYTMMSERIASGSALRYTTVTMIPGVAILFLITVVVERLGWVTAPSGAQVAEHWLGLAYLGIGGIAIAMPAWNAGLRRVGALNTMLFMSFMPVVTFVIRVVQGVRFEPIEIVGAGLVVGALIANNLFLRAKRRAVPR